MKHCFLKKMIHITKIIHNDYVVPKYMYNKYYKNITIKTTSLPMKHIDLQFLGTHPCLG